MQNPWWKTYFTPLTLAGYGLSEKTAAEVRGISRALALKSHSRILDLCCGAGRHSLLLAKAGHRVTGVDISPSLLKQAREDAGRLGLEAQFIRGDVRNNRFRGRFDAAVNLFTSFGYFEREADDLRLLKAAHAALKPRGRFLIDVLNRDWVIRHFTPRFWQKEKGDGVVKAFNELKFDPRTSRLRNRRTLFLRDGSRKKMLLNIRIYTLYDLTRLLEAAGFSIERSFGGFDLRPYSLDSFRMIIAARK